jgi:putative flippase GtrA
MRADPTRESGRTAFLRFGISGVVFTILGPSLFWLAYPLGPFHAVALAEVIVHTVRFLTFRLLVFPAQKGYRVTLPRYVMSALPVSLSGFASVAMFRNRLDRTSLTITTALIGIMIGFFWSRYVFERQTVSNR